MDFIDPHLVAPERLWLLLPAFGALAVIFLLASRRRRAALAKIAAPAMLSRLLAGHDPRRRALKNALVSASVALVLIAFARPRWGVLTTPSSDIEDIVFLFDASRSMDARDVEPTRLARAKRAMNNFLGMHTTGRLGLVAFAGEAFIQCPLTADRDVFEKTVDEIDSRIITTQGTDIGAAIREGLSALGATEKKRDDAIPGSLGALILITDGEDLENEAIKAAEAAAKHRVKIHAIGVGGPEGFQIRDSATGEFVTTRLDEKTLKAVAEKTGGKYFRLGGPDDNFGAVETELGLATAGSRSHSAPKERFPIFLGMAALLLAAERLVSTRRPLKTTP